MLKTTEHIRSLDLCRGLAALLILIYHTRFLYTESPALFKSAYLCVDFFFLLSGFVIANSYENKLRAGLGVLKFSAYRIARLWPLVVLTTLLGLAVQLPRWQREFGTIDVFSAAVTTVSNALSLPAPTSPNTFLFPLNGAAWSIFFEFAVNIAYALLLPFLRSGVLIAIIIGGGIGLAATGIFHNTLDVGWSTSNFIFGFPRVTFSFFLGVYISRMERDIWPTLSLPPWILTGSLLLVLLALNAPPNLMPGAKGTYDFLITALAFPALLIVALRTHYRSWGNTVSWFLGGISYSVYLLQTPLVIGFSGIPQVLFGTKIGAYVPWAGIVFVMLCVPLAYLTWVYFEQPAQRWLRPLLLGERSPRMQSLGAVEK